MEVQIIDLKRVKTFKYSDDRLKVELVPLDKGLSFWHKNQMRLRRQYKNRNKLRFTDYFLLKKYPDVFKLYPGLPVTYGELIKSSNPNNI